MNDNFMMVTFLFMPTNTADFTLSSAVGINIDVTLPALSMFPPTCTYTVLKMGLGRMDNQSQVMGNGSLTQNGKNSTQTGGI